MAVTRLKRKDRKNKARANNRVTRIGQLKSLPVIRKVDIEAIKASFGTVSKKKPAKAKVEEAVQEEVEVAVAEAPVEEVKEVVEELVAESTTEPVAEATPEVAEVEAPKEVKEETKPEKEETKPAAEAAPKDDEARVKELLKSIGTATEADKNDLKLINGIGPKYESFLNSVGMYTFEQIGKLKAADLDNLAEFSGLTREKIEKEDWMGQAKKLIDN